MKKIFILILGLSLTAASCNVFDIGAGTRGVFKSEDGGETYVVSNNVPPKDDINSLAVTSLAFNPSNPDTIYASAGAGIYKSEDGANSWKYILSGISVVDIAVDQSNTNTIYASGIVGSSGKIIKSVDAGVTWVDIYSEPSKDNTVMSVGVARNNSLVVLAGLINGELIRSTDAGKTWQAVTDINNRIIEIEFGVGNVVYALGSKAGLYRSPDLGVTWVQVSTVLTEDTLSSVNNSISSVTAFYDLALDPRQNGVVYLSTEEGLYRSVDDCANWSFVTLPVRDGALKVASVSVDPTNSNVLFAAVTSTIYKSINGGLTWETKVLPTSSTIDSILINPTSSNIIYLGLN